MLSSKKEEKMKGSKNIRAVKSSVDFLKKYTLPEAIGVIKDKAFAKFDETLEVVMKLGVNPKYSDQMVRGVVSLPHGVGKKIKVAVFARNEKAEEAKKAGAEIVGAEDLMEEIQKNNIDFDVCIATPDMMGVVGRVAKILGPKGKMPNPKLGTVSNDVAQAVETVKSGQVEFKVEKAGIIHAGVGKLSFDQQKLIDNVQTFINKVAKSRPSGAKGVFVKEVYLSSTMGVGLCVDISTLEKLVG